MIIVQEYKCTGCRACEFACSFKQKQFFHYNYSLIRVIKNKKMEGFFIPILCFHCDEMYCAKECPTDAIKRDSKTGLVTLDKQLCNGCGSCLDLCPWSAPIIDDVEGVAKICDFCQGDPLCVKFCSPGALLVKK